MNRPVAAPPFGLRAASTRHASSTQRCGTVTRPGGFTLVEVMVATVVTLILMGLVVEMFGMVGTSVSESRSTMEMVERLRNVRMRLQTDLAGVTAPTVPTLSPENDQGYFEASEGPSGPVNPVINFGIVDPDGDGTGLPDTTVGDLDDMLMFTTRSLAEPFVGRAAGGTITSPVAEVCYFVRGTTLYRRVLLVKPGITVPTMPGFYGEFDISVRQVGGTLDRSPNAGPPTLVTNSLGDLTKRQNRYGHPPFVFPHDVRFWGALGMPTLRECTFVSDMDQGPANWKPRWPFPLVEHPQVYGTGVTWPAGNPDIKNQYIFPNSPNVATNNNYIPLTLSPGIAFDAWNRTNIWDQVDPANGALYAFSGDHQPHPPATPVDGNTRVAEDVILTHVLKFDLKFWDPQAPVLAHFGVDAQPGVAGVDDDLDGNTDTVSGGGFDIDEFGAAGSDDVILQPGDTAYVPGLNTLGTTTVVISRGAYVDLNYTSGSRPNLSAFAGPGNPRSQLPMVYDTGTTSYESDGIDQDGSGGVDEATNGFDDDLVGGVDDYDMIEPWIDVNGNGTADPGEYVDLNNNNFYDPLIRGENEAPVPYAAPLRGIQIQIRCFDPSSKQIREVTVIQEFLPE